MPSINSKEIIDSIIAADGYYCDDPRVIAIHKYTNQWGGTTYHIAYSQRDIKRLFDIDSRAINPELIWEAK